MEFRIVQGKNEPHELFQLENFTGVISRSGKVAQFVHSREVSASQELNSVREPGVIFTERSLFVHPSDYVRLVLLFSNQVQLLHEGQPVAHQNRQPVCIRITRSYGCTCPQDDNMFLGFIEAGLLVHSGKQVTLLTELGKVLVPTIAATTALAFSGIGFLHSRYSQVFSSLVFQIGILLIFALLLASLGIWIHVIEYMVDCSAGFERIGELPPKRIDFLNMSWERGATWARWGTVCFFTALNAAVFLTFSCLADSVACKPVT
jgi:hypothetical protein